MAIVLKTVFFSSFCRLKGLMFVHLFFTSNSTIDSRKTSITPERLVIESLWTLRSIAFLCCQLMHNIRSHFNELILVWSVCFKNRNKHIRVYDICLKLVITSRIIVMSHCLRLRHCLLSISKKYFTYSVCLTVS